MSLTPEQLDGLLADSIQAHATSINTLGMVRDMLRSGQIVVGKTPKPVVTIDSQSKWDATAFNQSHTDYRIMSTVNVGKGKTVDAQDIRIFGTGTLLCDQYGVEVLNLSSRCEDVEIDGLTFVGDFEGNRDSAGTVGGKSGMPVCIRARGKRIRLRGLTAENVGDLLNANGGIDGLVDCIAEDCVAVVGLTGYAAYIEGRRIALKGWRVEQRAPSGQGHCFRTGPFEDLDILDCDLLRTLNAALYITAGKRFRGVGNHIRMGHIGLGPLKFETNRADRLVDFLLADNVLEAGTLTIGAGCERGHVRNNIIRAPQDAPLSVHGFDEQWGRGVVDVAIEHNTLVQQARYGPFLAAWGGGRNIGYRRNLHIAAHPQYQPNAAEMFVKLGQPTLDGWDVEWNVWPDKPGPNQFRLSTDHKFSAGPQVDRQGWANAGARAERYVNAAESDAQALGAGAVL